MSTHSPTKRELREQRRAERLAAEEAAKKQASRRRGVWMLAAAAGVAAIAVAAAVVLSHNSSKPTAAASGSVTSAASMFAGIPEHNGVLGDPEAPVTVTEYIDLQCPICDEASKNMLPTLVRDYVRTGKVKLQARTLHFIGPDSVKAARVAAGAQQQGKLWPFLETFYANQGEENSGYVTDSFLRQVAQASGVNAAAALGQANSAFASARLNQANTDASKLGIDSTPTLTVAKGNGPAKLLNANAVDAGSVSAALNQELGA